MYLMDMNANLDFYGEVSHNDYLANRERGLDLWQILS